MADKIVSQAVKKFMKSGEKIAPVKAIKLKVKFQEDTKRKALEKKMKDHKKEKDEE